MNDPAAAMVELARSVIGLAAGDGGELDAYADLIGPNESSARRRELDADSGCGLVVRGLWRRLGIRHPRLLVPYRTGKALEDVYAIARDAEALRHAPFVIADFGPGNVVHVQRSPVDAGHVFTILDPQVVLGGSAVELVSADGGQRIEGKEGIVEIVRTIFPDRASDSRRTPPAITRTVAAVVDVVALWMALGEGDRSPVGPAPADAS